VQGIFEARLETVQAEFSTAVSPVFPSGREVSLGVPRHSISRKLPQLETLRAKGPLQPDHGPFLFIWQALFFNSEMSL
jgi:hypothetical protein